MKLYDRWDWFWQTRIDENGDFKRFAIEINNYNQLKASGKGLPEWKCLG